MFQRVKPENVFWRTYEHPVKIQIIGRPDLRSMQLRPTDKQVNQRIGSSKSRTFNMKK